MLRMINCTRSLLLPQPWGVLAVQVTMRRTVNGSANSSSVKHEKLNQQNVLSLSRDYKLPLVWIDLEMTGLNVEVDRILEIACIITDGTLKQRSGGIGDIFRKVNSSFCLACSFFPKKDDFIEENGPDLVIHQSKESLDGMGEWCQSHHAASGLTKKVLESTISEREAEKQVIEFVKRNVGSYTPSLAGNSIYVDFLFLKKYMPELSALFSHVLVDVSSVKALCIRWYPKDQRKAPSKENRHRAMDDIRESIKELRYYKEKIFKSNSRK
ncbi:oligoribonuclease [Quillaja saponaria]|uniref:Oligoribonuclease n=1 Tax=Quillaja saponaria TaxID=32244 RepID=A0AAD7LM64_QUISA|nr:oligoribonuclease [Quillaja saponaria]